MMNDNQLEKIAKFLYKEYCNNDFTDVSIFKNEFNEYELFEKFFITKNNHSYKVTYKHSFTEKIFFSLKNAVAFCIFEHCNKITQSQRVEFLDSMISSVENNILRYRKFIKNTVSVDDKLIYVAKLSHDLIKKKTYSNELKKYLNESNHLQIQKFLLK